MCPLAATEASCERNYDYGTGPRISTSVGGMLTRLYDVPHSCSQADNMAKFGYPLIEARHFQGSKNALVV